MAQTAEGAKKTAARMLGITLCHDCHEREHYKPDSIRNLRKAKRGKTLY